MKRAPSRAPSQRQLRVGEEIRHALAWVMERGDLRDPAFHGVVLTITEVRVSPDLRNATVFVVPLGGGDATPQLEALTRSQAFLRHELARRVRLRSVPRLSFKADESFDEASHIDALLHSPEVSRDLGPRDEEPEEDDNGA
ncbi:30S ribosome-binding factor RbfA [Magnetospira sp. QH-2]|uniref:30S ribosome-binding factor RbfA n=1 Tax=Magnetospira sp. (strain QH-2) TaxID=1288970 RepID=UPI0003E80A52|nr:30S ribosome-binding factor RbfA [Magnetospira sp. QH-2]CCQ75720.1 Ribosome-binding factor A [Magnetospira sp. QH-2]